MPLARYFAYVGGALLALLFIVDWYFPSPNAEAAHSDVDRATIRIHSSYKWPKAVVFDTTLPTIVPPPAATAAVETPAAERLREAFAMVEAPPAAKPAEAVKPAKPHVRRARVARAPGNHVASYDMFGPRSETSGFRNEFFGSRSTWPANW